MPTCFAYVNSMGKHPGRRSCADSWLLAAAGIGEVVKHDTEDRRNDEAKRRHADHAEGYVTGGGLAAACCAGLPQPVNVRATRTRKGASARMMGARSVRLEPHAPAGSTRSSRLPFPTLRIALYLVAGTKWVSFAERSRTKPGTNPGRAAGPEGRISLSDDGRPGLG